MQAGRCSPSEPVLAPIVFHFETGPDCVTQNGLGVMSSAALIFPRVRMEDEEMETRVSVQEAEVSGASSPLLQRVCLYPLEAAVS